MTFLTPHFGLAPDSESESGVDLPSRAKGGILGMASEEASTREAMDFFFDMKLAGAPLQCSDDDGTCTDMWWVKHQNDG